MCFHLHRPREPCPVIGLQHTRFQFQSPADVHGDSMKKKLDLARHVDSLPPQSALSASLKEMLPRRAPTDQRISSSLNLPVQLPIHTRNMSEAPVHSTISPRAAGFHYGDRSPVEGSDIDRSPPTRTKRN